MTLRKDSINEEFQYTTFQYMVVPLYFTINTNIWVRFHLYKYLLLLKKIENLFLSGI